MHEMIKDTLFISDLDGTLLSPDSVITPKSVDLLNDAVGKGALFTAATARTPATLCTILRDVRLRLPVICMTGSSMWHPSTNVYTEVRYMAPHTAREVISVYREIGFPTFIYTLVDNMIHVYHLGPLSRYEHDFMLQRLSSPYKTYHCKDCGEALPPDLDHVILIFAMQPVAEARKAYDRIVADVADCNPIFYPDIFNPEIGFMEVFGADSTKGKAIDRLKQLTGARRIVAFGDNVNDIPMLRQADVAVAVGNAVPQLKEVADIVIGRNTEDSVARFINDCASGVISLPPFRETSY